MTELDVDQGHDDDRLCGLDPGTARYEHARRALAAYDEHTAGIPDVFDLWDDRSLLADDPDEPRLVPPADLARSYLAMVTTWWTSVVTLADDLAGVAGEDLRDLVEREAAAVLRARTLVVTSWARLTLGTAGPTPTIDSAHVATATATVLIRGDALDTTT